MMRGLCDLMNLMTHWFACISPRLSSVIFDRHFIPAYMCVLVQLNRFGIRAVVASLRPLNTIAQRTSTKHGN